MGEHDIAMIGLPGIPLVGPGDDLVALIADTLARGGETLRPLDVLVIASTIVSKAEGRFFELDDIVPSDRAHELAAQTKKDPRLVEIVLQESSEVVRATPGVLIVRHRLGFVSANAGIDFSNVAGPGDRGILLPLDPDRSAAALGASIESAHRVSPIGVVISDTHGHAFRKGNVGVAIGVAGLPALVDERGSLDLYGRTLEATVVPLADLVASAAGIVSGEGHEALPVILVRGVTFEPSMQTSAALSWPPAEDLFASQ